MGRSRSALREEFLRDLDALFVAIDGAPDTAAAILEAVPPFAASWAARLGVTRDRVLAAVETSSSLLASTRRRALPRDRALAFARDHEAAIEGAALPDRFDRADVLRRSYDYLPGDWGFLEKLLEDPATHDAARSAKERRTREPGPPDALSRLFKLLAKPDGQKIDAVIKKARGHNSRRDKSKRLNKKAVRGSNALTEDACGSHDVESTDPAVLLGNLETLSLLRGALQREGGIEALLRRALQREGGHRRSEIKTRARELARVLGATAVEESLKEAAAVLGMKSAALQRDLERCEQLLALVGYPFRHRQLRD
jgi:hypothetical protein